MPKTLYVTTITFFCFWQGINYERKQASCYQTVPRHFVSDSRRITSYRPYLNRGTVSAKFMTSSQETRGINCDAIVINCETTRKCLNIYTGLCLVTQFSYELTKILPPIYSYLKVMETHTILMPNKIYSNKFKCHSLYHHGIHTHIRTAPEIII